MEAREPRAQTLAAPSGTMMPTSLDPAASGQRRRRCQLAGPACRTRLHCRRRRPRRTRHGKDVIHLGLPCSCSHRLISSYPIYSGPRECARMCLRLF